MFDNTIQQLKKLYFVHGENWFLASEYTKSDGYLMSPESLDICGLVRFVPQSYSPNSKMKIEKKAIDYFRDIV